MERMPAALTQPQVSSKRRQDVVQNSARKLRKTIKSRQVTTHDDHETHQSGVQLLDLPAELLVEIFVYSSSDAFPATCKYLYEIFHANPQTAKSLDGPPLWLQHRFIRHTNPTLAFAVQTCLRRRFFGATTFKAYVPELIASASLSQLTVPLRCLLKNDERRFRSSKLFTELIQMGICLPPQSWNKGLHHLAGTQSSMSDNSFFWDHSTGITFERSAILQAFKSAGKKQFFGPGKMFDQLVKRFGIDEEMGYQLYDVAAKIKDQAFLNALQSHNIKPGMNALKLMTT